MLTHSDGAKGEGAKIMTIPRKLSEQEIDAIERHYRGLDNVMDAAARLRYLEQRMQEAESLLAMATPENAEMMAKHIRAFLAEGGE